MRKQLYIILAAVLGVTFSVVTPSHVFAQSGLVPISQGDQSVASTTCKSQGDCYFIYLGTGNSFTATTIFTTVSHPSLAQTPPRVDLFSFPDSSYSAINEDCEFVLTTPTTASSTQDRLQYTGNCVLDPAMYYLLDLPGSGDNPVHSFYWGGTFTSLRYPISYYIYPGNGSPIIFTSGFEPQFAIAANGFTIIPTASSTGLFLSGAQEFCNGQFGTSTGGVFGIGTDIANGLCQVLGYMFVPTPDSVGQFSNLEPLLEDKLPFSYVAGVQSTWDSLTASSSTNVPQYTINLGALGIGSTTALGNILPNQMDLLSSSTINHYLPAGVHDALYTLAEVAIALTAVAFMYEEGKRLIKT